MRDSRRNQERTEIRLDRVQVIWLTLGGVVALCLVFALGVLVGRRAASFAPTPAVADPIAQVDAAGDLHEELTFYDKLTEPAPAKRSPPKRIAAAPAEPNAAPELDEAPEPNAAPKPTPAPVAEPPVAASPAPAAPTPASEDAAIRDALAGGPAKPGDYTIQVSAYQSMAEAQAYKASLERRGFKPYIVTGHVRGRGVWYRVRLGRFASESQANLGKALLARADIPAWVLKSE
jgi:septal ring-binding cell division protein DamX